MGTAGGDGVDLPDAEESGRQSPGRGGRLAVDGGGVGGERGGVSVGEGGIQVGGKVRICGSYGSLQGSSLSFLKLYGYLPIALFRVFSFWKIFYFCYYFEHIRSCFFHAGCRPS